MKADSGVSGLMMCGTVPGRWKTMVLRPDERNRFASLIACRNEPRPLSLVLITTKVPGGTVLVARIHGENSDVLPFGSVAVAVIYRPWATPGTITLNGPGERLALPRYSSPSPWPEGSHSTLEKKSTS